MQNRRTGSCVDRLLFLRFQSAMDSASIATQHIGRAVFSSPQEDRSTRSRASAWIPVYGPFQGLPCDLQQKVISAALGKMSKKPAKNSHPAKISQHISIIIIFFS
jgi:hypothetical protein